MQYRKYGDTYAVRIDLNEEIMQSLKALCEKEDIRLAQVDAIGAANRAVIGVYDIGKQAYRKEELTGFMEITSLSGSVTRMNGEAYLHLHGTLADQNHVLHGGHVIEMTVGATCEMFVRTLPGEVSRARDQALGINLMVLQ
ncbi:MAG: DNA-binding protein [Clostridia bacterium]|nr:DNA-binding protein [Clostridia bacterium]